MSTFIYVIENKVNGHAYIGKTKVPEKRWKKHKDAARECNEQSSWIYKAMSKHGIPPPPLGSDLSVLYE